MDFSGDITDALADVITGFTASLVAVIPVTFGLAALVLVYHRVRGLIN